MRSRRFVCLFWLLVVLAISRSRASLARSWPKCSATWGYLMDFPSEPFATARILIVDDHEDNVELLRARLQSWGYQPESAGDGVEALEKVEQSPPDLIQLD